MLPDKVAIKYGTYSLYCNQMLRHLHALEQAVATKADRKDLPEVSSERCFALFNQRLAEFFAGTDYSTLDQSADSLGRLIEAGVDILAGKGHEVTKVFKMVVADALAQASAWDFTQDLERYHEQGRLLAQKFFQESLFGNTQKNMSQKADLIFEYGDSDSSGRRPNMSLNLGYRVAPIATYHLTGAAGVPRIVMRVSYDNDFNLYLGYPFLFLHEYTAHILANDLKNAPFNDGWMLFAASDFLNSDWQDTEDGHPLQQMQVDVFRETFYGQLGEISRRGYNVAYKLRAWMERNSNGLSFQSMTYELAAFVPSGIEKDSWPTQCINALRREFGENRQGLAAKIENAKSLRMLYSTLDH